jgi:hypothetical protein
LIRQGGKDKAEDWLRRVLLEGNEHKRRLVQQSGPSRRIRHGKVIVTPATDVLLREEPDEEEDDEDEHDGGGEDDDDGDEGYSE